MQVNIVSFCRNASDFLNLTHATRYVCLKYLISLFIIKLRKPKILPDLFCNLLNRTCWKTERIKKIDLWLPAKFILYRQEYISANVIKLLR